MQIRCTSRQIGAITLIIILICVLINLQCSESDPLTAGDIVARLIDVKKLWTNAKVILSSANYVEDLCIQPGVVLIAYDKPEALNEMDNLPEWILPHSNDEVTTVILIEKEKKLVGHYTDGCDAYRWVWELWVVNIVEKKVEDETISGDSPPSSKTGEGDRIGSIPTDECIAWILENCESSD